MRTPIEEFPNEPNQELPISPATLLKGVSMQLYIGKNHIGKRTPAQSIFRLLGNDEDALTSALGFLLAHDHAFCARLVRLARIAPRRAIQPGYAIYLQEVTDRRFGRRDIVIESDGMRIVFEAKIDAGVPTAHQLLKYAEEDRLWARFRARGIVALTQIKLPQATREGVSSKLAAKSIRFSTVRWYDILDLALDHRPPDGSEISRYLFHEFVRYIRKDYEMGYYDAEILIQDVNPLNADIFNEGWMYVTSLSDKRAPLYFAPYFTKQGPGTGLSMIARVLETEFVRLADIDRLGDVTVAPSDKHHTRWSVGLEKLRNRAKSEGFEVRDTRLFFFDQPIRFRELPLTKRAFNETNPAKRIPIQIPKGFSLRFDELLLPSATTPNS